MYILFKVDTLCLLEHTAKHNNWKMFACGQPHCDYSSTTFHMIEEHVIACHLEDVDDETYDVHITLPKLEVGLFREVAKHFG
jgi:hypothetical protein